MKLKLTIELDGDKFDLIVTLEMDEDRNCPLIDHFELDSAKPQDDVYFNSFSERNIEDAIWTAYDDYVKESNEP